jgi:hypothetical protein
MSTARDFDFLVGSWRVSHRRRAKWLAQCEDWIEFDGTMRLQLVLGGGANVDDNEIALPSGHYRAVTLRSFDPATKQWSIWWLDGRWPNRLDTPVVGAFVDGVGTFYADDVYQDRPVRIRFLWNARACTWEQAFSDDNGASWETNWVMRFTRPGTSIDER